MSRLLETPILAAINSSSVEVIVLCEFDFASGPIRVWSGYGNITWSNRTWIGSGLLLKLGDVEETQDTSSVQLSFSLSGVPSDMLALVLGQQFQGRTCKVYLGVMSAGEVSTEGILTKTLHASQIYGGTMDTITIDEGGTTSTVTLSTQNAFYQLLRTRDLRYTSEAQKALFPNDNGLKYVASIQNQQVEWGAAS